MKNHWRFSSRTESQGLRLWRTQAMIFGIKCPGVNPSEKDWPHDKRSACPVRGEEPRSSCKCEGPPSGVAARPPHCTRSDASSHSSSKTRGRARAPGHSEEARAPGRARSEASLTRRAKIRLQVTECEGRPAPAVAFASILTYVFYIILNRHSRLPSSVSP